MFRAFFVLVPLLAACTPFPEVDRAAAPFADVPAPRLLTTAELGAIEGRPRGSDAQRAALEARAAALRGRAEAIRRRPVG